PKDRISSWYWAGTVALLAGLLRIVDIAHPPRQIFDEVYYAKDAHDLLGNGYELNAAGDGPGLVAHPPLGKWCIALGEWLFGYNSLGWRFSAAILGTLSVLILCRIGRRLFDSTLLGCLAGLLLSLDGLHFVSSRVALLDIFLMFFVLASFGCLVLDRAQRRDQLHAALLAATEAGKDLSRGIRRITGWRGWPWWRIAAAALLGCALGVKWSAVWFLPVFLLLIVLWEVQARRSAGVRHPISDVIGWETGWIVGFGVIAVVVFFASYTGWFITDGGWDRHWAQENGAGVWYLPDALVSLWHYQHGIYQFHANLSTPHSYQSTPYSWFVLERPVLYYYESDGPCGAATCSSAVLALGNPMLWWTFVVASAVCLWRGVISRDWRALAIALCAAGAIVPWMFYPDRTMYFFYALPALPFFVLAVTLALGLILGRRSASAPRRLTGALIVGVYVVLVIVAFAYFYPVYTGDVISYDDWRSRMWLESWI
ncbi:MAG: dolichyl-phosphate-mannose--protein mannosyltransferase, partial [Mycobacteriales bacterium]